MNDLMWLLLLMMRRSRRRYLGYLLSCTIAVSIFFSFGFFALHPDLPRLVDRSYVGVVVQVLWLGQLGVACFAAFFVIFFHRFLIRARSKEFGLLATLGVSPKQFASLMMMESAILGIIALALGFVLAVVETFALVAAIEAFPHVPTLSRNLSPLACACGTTFFVVLFAIDACLVARLVRSSTPRRLLAANRVGQSAARPSVPRIAAGLFALFGGYAMALGFRTSTATTQAALTLPTIGLVGAGTYLLFDQSLTGLVQFVRKRTSSGLVLLGASRLAHRLRDFSLILTVVSMLCAGVLGLMGVAFGVLSHLRQMAATEADLHRLLSVFAVLLFVFFFLALLFLLAAGSTLLMKLFTQLEDDRGQLAAFRRLGIRPRDATLLLRWELGILFFLPALAAMAHSLVAMGEFTTKVAPQRFSQSGAWTAFAWVVLGFALLMAAYFTLVSGRYISALERNTGTTPA